MHWFEKVVLRDLEKYDISLILLAFKHLLRVMHINPNLPRTAITEGQTDLCESSFVRDAAA